MEDDLAQENIYIILKNYVVAALYHIGVLPMYHVILFLG
jgi:hypothetical protein